MDEFKEQISEDVLNTLTIEDLWKNPGLKKYIQEKYPRAYMTITEPMREFGLYGFIKIAEAQKKLMSEALDIGSIEDFPKRDLRYALKVIKKNKVKSTKQLWVGGIPFKFELSTFVKHYASERTYSEWRQILKDIGTSKSNMERILTSYRKLLKDSTT